MATDAAVKAIEYALKTDEGIEFLRCWMHGDFNVIRKEWPDAPGSVFIGADSLIAPNAPPVCNSGREENIERGLFEQDAVAYGFDLTRAECATPEPWSEYADLATGHRWAGWLAKRPEVAK